MVKRTGVFQAGLENMVRSSVDGIVQKGGLHEFQNLMNSICFFYRDLAKSAEESKYGEWVKLEIEKITDYN